MLLETEAFDGRVGRDIQRESVPCYRTEEEQKKLLQ